MSINGQVLGASIAAGGGAVAMLPMTGGSTYLFSIAGGLAVLIGIGLVVRKNMKRPV